METKQRAETIARLINTAGGQFVGRIKLQKTFYLLQSAGLPTDFGYEYYHYGPYSETLTDAMNYGIAFGFFNETEKNIGNNCSYSLFSQNPASHVKDNLPKEYTQLAKKAATAVSVQLELAVTALYLTQEEHCNNAWEETKDRKRQKSANGQLEKAQQLYHELQAISPILPDIH